MTTFTSSAQKSSSLTGMVYAWVSDDAQKFDSKVFQISRLEPKGKFSISVHILFVKAGYLSVLMALESVTFETVFKAAEISGPYARGARGGKVPPFWVNYFKFTQFFARNRIYTSNFGTKIKIFLRFAPHPHAKFFKFAPLFKSLRTGLDITLCKAKKIIMVIMFVICFPKSMVLLCLYNQQLNKTSHSPVSAS